MRPGIVFHNVFNDNDDYNVDHDNNDHESCKYDDDHYDNKMMVMMIPRIKILIIIMIKGNSYKF